MNAKYIIIGLLTAATAGFASAADLTAYQLIKQGDQYVGIQSKDKVVQIRSDKSTGSLTPDIWYVVYYDPDATFKAIEVKFGAGEKMDVSRPGRVLEMVTDDKTPLEWNKLTVDSDRAIKIATDEPLLKNLTLKATKLWLEHGDTGPQWRVQIWAARLNDPGRDADVGTVTLSAADGSVIKLDLHPGSAD
jgi:hypothetical protein